MESNGCLGDIKARDVNQALHMVLFFPTLTQSLIQVSVEVSWTGPESAVTMSTGIYTYRIWRQQQP